MRLENRASEITSEITSEIRSPEFEPNLSLAMRCHGPLEAGDHNRPDEGMWFYLAPGSGVWLNVGRTIVGAEQGTLWKRMHCEEAEVTASYPSYSVSKSEAWKWEKECARMRGCDANDARHSNYPAHRTRVSHDRTPVHAVVHTHVTTGSTRFSTRPTSRVASHALRLCCSPTCMTSSKRRTAVRTARPPGATDRAGSGRRRACVTRAAWCSTAQAAPPIRPRETDSRDG